MIFNEKFNKIIDIATSYDPELEGMLEYWFSRLTKSQKEKVKSLQEFKDIVASLTFTDGKDRGIQDHTVMPNEVFLCIHEWSVQFNLFIKDIDEQWIDSLHTVKDENDEQLIYSPELSQMLFVHIVDYSKHYAKTYRLEMCKIDNKPVFNYVRSHSTIQDLVVEKNGIFEAKDSDLKEINTRVTTSLS